MVILRSGFGYCFNAELTIFYYAVVQQNKMITSCEVFDNQFVAINPRGVWRWVFSRVINSR